MECVAHIISVALLHFSSVFCCSLEYSAKRLEFTEILQLVSHTETNEMSTSVWKKDKI